MSRLIYYAIGDIHGEAEKLRRLHNLISATHDGDFPGLEKRLVYLGDYVDRGPDSFDVIKQLMEMESKCVPSTINLKGNHEQMMVAAYDTGKNDAYNIWLNNGGDETLSSYRKAGYDEPPKHHLDWMRGLPTYHWDRLSKIIFVHAGIDPVHFPNDGEDRHLWTRSRRFFDTSKWGYALPVDTTVIHGHTPTRSGHPDITRDLRRINIDTGACYGGNLTSVILAPGESPRFITA